MSGDELVAPPLALSWTHGITIRAAPEEVWPWIAQMGEMHGGFYSCTFIENFFAPQRTRLVVRLRARLELEAAGLPLALGGFFVNYGGFVMERKMMQGIKDRAEGRVEPAWYQGSEIAAWLVALGLGLAAGVAWAFRSAPMRRRK